MNMKNCSLHFFLHYLKLLILFLKLYIMKIMTYRNLILLSPYVLLIIIHISSSVQYVEEEVTTPSPPPKPYAFGYAAGRYPGHIDRTHSEVSDGSGVVQDPYYDYMSPLNLRLINFVITTVNSLKKELDVNNEQ
nr:unnamed protein product [Callosobruchus analis]